MAGTALIERLRGPSLDLDDALRLSLDVARELAVVHDRGVAHGGVEPAAVSLEGERARLGPPVPGAASRRDDLRGLGRVLLAALAGQDPGPGPPPPPERLRPGLPGGVRGAVGWLAHPADDFGAQSAGDAVRLLEALRDGQPADLATPPGWPDYATPLAPHRIALRLACQGGVAASIPLPLLALAGAPGEVWLPAAAGAATFGAAVTLAEELARPRARLRPAIALVAAAVTPALSVGAGGVVGAVQAGQTPHAGMIEVVDLLASEGRDLLQATALVGLPLAVFVACRAGRSASPSLLAVSLGAASALPAGVWTNAGPLAVVQTAVWLGALAVALKVGRRLETQLAGAPP